ncbi:Hypothetical predicted protein [Marmota monax]|uniref:Uncharacterized protein n=1 Tax=Marmota monax TaxID=9995 RepID=A0A5E4BWI2_MARMO|nr:Hypothetical predicted protein [Marmota monax]
MNSEVDESLFGGVKPLAQGQSDSPLVLLRDEHTIRRTLTALGLDHKPETIQLITRDMVRELIVPSKDPSGESLIISPEEFERIKGASHVPTTEEMEAREQAFKKEKEAIVDAVATRKKIMKQKEMVWRSNRKLSELEEVAKERAQNLLQRADKLRMEQEEELKDMSKGKVRKRWVRGGGGELGSGGKASFSVQLAKTLPTHTHPATGPHRSSLPLSPHHVLFFVSSSWLKGCRLCPNNTDGLVSVPLIVLDCAFHAMLFA